VYDQGVLAFTMPPQEGVGELAVDMSVDGVHYLPAPTNFTLAAPTTLASLTPACGALGGGTSVKIGGLGLIDTPDLAVLFVKGATRKVVPATYDAASGVATCVAPAWPPAVALAKSVAAATASLAEGDEPPPLDLTDAGDAIVEISLNGQQWTTDCKHFAFVPEPTVSACEPPSGALEGGGTVKLVAAHVADTGVLTVRLTKLDAPPEEGAPLVLPTGDDVVSLTVDATYAADGAEFVAPVFEGLEEAFDVVAQLANDGQVYGTSLALFKYEAAPAKGKKK